MLTKKKRWFAAALVAAMLCTSVSPAVAHAEETAVSTHNHGTYTATADLMDKKGVVTLKDLTWDEIVVPASLGASKVVLKNVIATKVVVEDASLCDIEILGGSIAMIELVKEEKKLTLRDMAELIASGMTKAEAQKAYQAAKDELAKKQAKTPVVVLKDKAVVGTLTVIGSEGRLAVDGFTGTLVVEQTAQSGNGYGMMELELNNSKPAKVEVSGKGKNSLVVTGTNSSIAEAVVDGSASLVLEVETKKLETAKDSTEVELVVLAPVEEVVINGEATDLNVTSDVVVKKAVINGANATVEGAGKVESAAVSDDSAKITTSGTEVYDPAKVTATPGPTATPKPTTAPSSGGSGSSGGGSYYPPYVPGPTATPKPTVTPTPGAAHTHSWVKGEVVAATCTEGGYTNYTCSCKETKKDNITAPNGHAVETWEQGDKVEGTTCTYNRTGYCTTCKQDVSSEITMDVHAGTKVVITSEATCKSEGTKNYVCTACDKTISTDTYSNPDAHKWGIPVTGEDGKMIYTCTVDGCGTTKSVVELVNGEVSRELVDDATEVKVGNVVMSLDDAVLAKVDAAAGTTASGAALKLSADVLSEEDRTSATANMDEDELELLGESEIYDFNMSVDDTEMSELGGNVTVRIPYKLEAGEDPDGIEVWYVKDGRVTVINNAIYHDNYVSFATNHFSYYTAVYLTPIQRCARDGHDWETTTVAATCTEDGYKAQTCKLCAETTAGETIVANGHVMQKENVQIANCKQQGIIRYYCKNCDYENRVETPLGDHTRDTDGKCTVCGINVDCKHENTVYCPKLASGATKCEDGVIVTQYCLECEGVVSTKEWKEEGHYSSTLDYFSFYPYGAPGYVYEQGCPCGGSEHGNNFYMNTNGWSNGKYNSGDWVTDRSQGYNDDEGRWHDVTIRTSEIAKVKIEFDTCTLSQRGCACEKDKCIKIYVDGTLVKEMGGVVTEKDHYYGAKVTLNEGSETCLDGVTIEEYCLRCGSEYGSWTGKTHWPHAIEYIDLSEYSEKSCNGVLVYSKCACGAKETIFKLEGASNSSCGLYNWTEGSNEENGKTVYTRTSACDTCGFLVEDVYMLEDLDDCKVNRVGTITITVDDVVKESYEYSIAGGLNHKSTYRTVELAEGSTSCEEGAIFTEHCADCEQVISSWTDKTQHAGGTKQRFDVTKYGDTCGDGVFSWMSCACGKSQNCVLPSECEFSESETNSTDENNVVHYIKTAHCNNCDINYIQDVVSTTAEDGTTIRTYSYQVYMGETLLGEFSFDVRS